MKVAAIDIGSNSIHVVIARIDMNGHFTVLDRAKEMIGLGKGTLATRLLSRETMRAGLEALATFKRLIEAQQVDRVLAVATSAVREAKNGGAFITEIGRELGLHVDVITGREEARLIHLAVSNALDLRDESVLLVDVGGGSVEFVLVERGTVTVQESLKLGVLRLAERFIANGRPRREEVAQLEEHLGRRLAALLKRVRAARPARLIGTSGTVANLAAIATQLEGKTPLERLHACSVSYKDVLRVRKAVLRDREARQRLPGLDRRRVDTIVPGAILVEYVMRALDVGQLVVCEWALREGVILDFVRRHRDEIEETDAIADVRRRSVLHLMHRLDTDETHARQVARIAVSLFDQTSARHGLGVREREWLEFAALLHDVGHHIGHAKHHRHSYYLIVNGELLGFEPKEIQLIAALARYHRKGAPQDGDDEIEVLPRSLRPVVAPLAALLRIADGLDRSHFGVVRDLVLGGTERNVTLTVRAGSHDAELERWATGRKAELFEQVFGARLVVAMEAEGES